VRPARHARRSTQRHDRRLLTFIATAEACGPLPSGIRLPNRSLAHTTKRFLAVRGCPRTTLASRRELTRKSAECPCRQLGCSSTRWTASPRSVDESRSTSRSTPRYFRMPRFAARRRTRCISAPGTRCQPTWRQARPPPDGPAWRPTDPRPAGRAPQSTRPPDHRQRPVCRPPRPAAPSIWERRREQPGTAREASRRVEPVRDHVPCPIAAPCHLHDGNSRKKVQNVRGVFMSCGHPVA